MFFKSDRKGDRFSLRSLSSFALSRPLSRMTYSVESFNHFSAHVSSCAASVRAFSSSLSLSSLLSKRRNFSLRARMRVCHVRWHVFAYDLSIESLDCTLRSAGRMARVVKYYFAARAIERGVFISSYRFAGSQDARSRLHHHRGRYALLGFLS